MQQRLDDPQLYERRRPRERLRHGDECHGLRVLLLSYDSLAALQCHTRLLAPYIATDHEQDIHHPLRPRAQCAALQFLPTPSTPSASFAYEGRWQMACHISSSRVQAGQVAYKSSISDVTITRRPDGLYAWTETEREYLGQACQGQPVKTETETGYMQIAGRVTLSDKRADEAPVRARMRGDGCRRQAAGTDRQSDDRAQRRF